MAEPTEQNPGLIEVISYEIFERYSKLSFKLRNDPSGETYSIIAWQAGGASAIHDHNVNETTHLVRGDFFEERETEKGLVNTTYTEGEIFKVSAGPRHRIKALGPGLTLSLNRCFGHLKMHQFPSFSKK